MKVQEIMVSHPAYVREEDTLFEVSQTLSKKRFHAVPVVDESGTLMGIITQYDLFMDSGDEMEYLPSYVQKLQRIISKGDVPEALRKNIEKFSSMKASDLMTRKCLTLDPDSDTKEAIFVFQKTNFGSIPVVDGQKKLIGIVTLRDILKIFPQVAP
jgi:CBS domain-containing protein